MKLKLSNRVQTAVTFTVVILGLAGVTLAAEQEHDPNPPATNSSDPSDSHTSKFTEKLQKMVATAVQPAEPPAMTWIDPGWKDTGQVFPEVIFDLPLSEVANRIRSMFKDTFDVIVPGSCDWQDPVTGMASPLRVDPSGVSIKLRLKNVTATEVFNAMNLVFEAEDTPLRWELKMNGNRPLALLRVMPALSLYHGVTLGGAPVPPPVEKKRMVFFVGDLLGEGRSGGMTMQQLFDTVRSVYDMGFGGGPALPSQSDLNYHKDAQLIIVTASPDRIDFVRNTLAALEEKERVSERKAREAKMKSEAAKKTEAAPEPAK